MAGPVSYAHHPRRGRGFRQTASLLDAQMRQMGEKRGFAVSRLLTQWAAIVGDDIAAVCQPVKVTYSQGGFGGTLSVLTTGAAAPMLEMQLPRLREKVNACYGYNAISRVRITQTAPIGFSEGQARFQPRPPAPKQATDGVLRQKADNAVEGIADPTLRAVLADFGANVMQKQWASKDKEPSQ